MSQSTPSQPPVQSQHRPSATTATPRFSPYPPAALRTSLFHQPFRPSTPSSASNPILSTPRSLALPSRISTPYTNGRLPSAPQNTPLSVTSSSSSSFGPHRSTPLGLSSTLPSSTIKKGHRNPFDKLTATDFDQFVNGLRDKVKNALDPGIERKRRKEEREERQRIRDEREQERQRIEQEKQEVEMRNSKPSTATKDVFGEVKNVSAEDIEQEEEVEEDEDENLVNGQEVKIDPNQPLESSEEEVSNSAEEAEDVEEEDSIEFERPKSESKGKPLEIVILDSDEEEEEKENETRSSLEREESIEGEDEEFSDGEEQETGDSGTEGDDLQPISSRSPTPESLPSHSPRKSLHQPSRAAPHARPPIEYPSLSVSTSRESTEGFDVASPNSDSATRRLSSSPDANARQPRNQNRERSPLFRPRNEGSVSLSAPEDYDFEVDRDYFSQEEEGEAEASVEGEGIDTGENDTLETQKVRAENGDDLDRDVFGSNVKHEHDEDRDQAEEQDLGEAEARDGDEEEEEEGMFDLPPVSQRKKRDAFGRPIRYQEEDGEGGEFDGYEEEEGFGEQVQDEVQDYQLFDQGQGAEGVSSSQAEYGFRLEDLVEQSMKEADRMSGEAAEKVETEEEPENLGMIELDDSDEDEPTENHTLSNPDLQAPVAPAAIAPSQPQLTDSIDLLAAAIAPEPTSSDTQLDETLQLATSTLSFPLSTSETAPPPTTEALPPQPFPTSDQFLPQAAPLPLPLPQSILQDEIFYDFRTPPEAQEELLDVDQVRVREIERLPFLQEAEIGKAFEGYEDQELQESEINASKDAEMELDGETSEGKVEEDQENRKLGEDSPQSVREEEGEYFGEGVPGDEVVPGGELESEDEGFDRRANYSGEDSEDLRSRIPYEAKGKGRALPTPSLDSDDPSRFALSEQEEDAYSQSSDYESDEDHPWRPELLLDYELGDLERLMRTLGSQLNQARSSRNQARIRQQLEDVQEFYINKGGEIFDGDDEDDEAGDERDDIENEMHLDDSEGQAFDISPDDDEPHLSPDRSAFVESTAPTEDSLDPADRQARDQVFAIAHQLVDLQSSSNPYPSLRIGSSSIDHPEANFSAHFRQEDAPQPKLDDPINLPPPPSTSTNVNDPVESQQQNSELDIERVVTDEQQPIELPKGEETKLDYELQEQVDQVDSAATQDDGGGLTIVDDDESFDRSTSSHQVPQVDLTTREESTDGLASTLGAESATEKSLAPPVHPSSTSEAEVKPIETPMVQLQTVSAVPTSTVPAATRNETSTLESSSSIESSKILHAVPASSASKSSVFDISPFVPLPPSATSSISRSSGPDLSRFSSHFRFEPNGPPPSLDSPLNLPAPPSSTTNVDEPIIREQQDEELEPEIQASNEEEVNDLHGLSEMVDLSRGVKPHEAEDFEQPQSKEELMTIIDDDEPPPLQPVGPQEQDLGNQTSVSERRSRVGATPPPPSVASRFEDSMIVEGSAPPQHPALLPPSLPQTPSTEAAVPLSEPIPDSASLPPTSASDPTASLSQPLTEIKKDSGSLAADEIRFDDISGEQSLEEDDEVSSSASDNGNDESEAEVAHVLLSPHKRSGGVLGFSGGADEFGETILMNSDSEEEEADEFESMQAGTNGDLEVEELDLDSVKMALRKQNEEEENRDEEKSKSRQTSAAPSSEPISYASSDEGKSTLEDDVINEDHFDRGDFGGGLEEEDGAEQLAELGDLPASPNRSISTALHIHNVLEPGEWDPSQPIEFGPSPTAKPEFEESKGGDFSDGLSPEAGSKDAETYASAERDAPLVAVVDMGEETSDPEAPTETATIAEEVAQNVAEALAAELDSVSDERLPAIEVAPEVIEEAVGSSEPKNIISTAELSLEQSPAQDKESQKLVPEIQVPQAEFSTGAGSTAPASDQSESGDEILLASRPSRSSARHSPRPSTSAHREDRPSTFGRPPLSADNLEVPSPIRRSSRLSSAGPASSSTDSPSSCRGKRSRRSEENGAAASSSLLSSVKKAKRTGHGLKYREDVTEDEEPVPIAGSRRTNLRLHHHHHQPAESAPVSSHATKLEPPVTRSRCHFTRLKITSRFNKDSPPYEFLVPACALTSPIAIETMKRSAVQNLGPVDESMHCRGTSLGGRGFDSDAAKLMSDRHPSKLVPDEDVLDVVRRIVGTEIFDEGEVELLPRQVDEAQEDRQVEEDVGEREEREIEEGEVVE